MVLVVVVRQCGVGVETITGRVNFYRSGDGTRCTSEFGMAVAAIVHKGVVKLQAVRLARPKGQDEVV